MACPGREVVNGYLEGAGPGEEAVLRCGEGFQVAGLGSVGCVSGEKYSTTDLPSCTGEFTDTRNSLINRARFLQ